MKILLLHQRLSVFSEQVHLAACPCRGLVRRPAARVQRRGTGRALRAQALLDDGCRSDHPWDGCLTREQQREKGSTCGGLSPAWIVFLRPVPEALIAGGLRAGAADLQDQN